MRRLLLSLAATLAVTGCGGSDSSSKPAAPAPASSSSSSAAAPATSGGGTAIAMKGIQFAPQDVTVKVGTKITWTDQEDIAHNVTADSGATFKSKTFGRDGTFSYTPKKAGTITYECTIHPGMKGKITVEG